MPAAVGVGVVAQAAAHLDAVDVGHGEVEADEVVGVDPGLGERLVAVEGDVDGVALAPQPAPDRPRPGRPRRRRPGSHGGRRYCVQAARRRSLYARPLHPASREHDVAGLAPRATPTELVSTDARRPSDPPPPPPRRPDATASEPAWQPSARVESGAVRGQEGHRRPGPRHRAAAGLPARPGPRACSKACPAWPRPSRSRRSPGSSAARSPACSSPPTCCPPTSWAPASTAARPRPSTSSSARCSPTSCSPTRSTGRRPRCSRRCSRSWPSTRCRSAAQTFPAPDPFLVLATQNPIESEGVYPLPEAQRDRFLMKIVVGYPTPTEEVEIVHRMGVRPPVPSQILEPRAICSALQEAADAIYVDRGVIDYAVNLVLATRDPASLRAARARTSSIGYGASPRASLGLVRAGRALALLRGRTYALPQDVFDVAPDILRHRLVLSYEALARDLTADHVLARVLSTVPAPRISPVAGSDACAPTQTDPLASGEGAVAAPVTDSGLTVRHPRRRASSSAPPRAARHAQARRPAAGRLPRSRPRPRLRARRDPRVPARRRRAPHRLERHRPHADSPRPRDHRRSRARDVGAASISRPASTSAPPTWRSATSRSAATAAVGFLTAKVGNRLGAVLVDGRRRSRRCPPARAATHLMAVLHRVQQAPRRGTVPAPARRPRPTSPPASADSRGPGHRRGLAVVVSDLLGPQTVGKASCAASRCATTCSSSRCVDPRELELPDVGMLALVDPETGQRPRGQHARARKLRAALRRRSTRAARAERPRWFANAAPTTSCCAPTRDWLLDIVRFVALRRKRMEVTANTMTPIFALDFISPAAAVVARCGRRARSPPTWRCSGAGGTYAVRFTNVDLLDKVAPKRPGLAPPRRRRARSSRASRAAGRGVRRTPTRCHASRANGPRSCSPSTSRCRWRPPTSNHRASTAPRKPRLSFVDTSCPTKINVGLVSFSGTRPIMLVPPTTDRERVRTAIDNLELGEGTAIGDAILSPPRRHRRPRRPTSEGTPPPAAIVLMSDGKTTVRHPRRRGRAARRRGRRARVDHRLRHARAARITLPRANGTSIPVPVDEEALAKIADATGGASFDAESTDELKSIYPDIGSAVGYEKAPREITRWFVGLAMLAALMTAGLSLAWFQTTALSSARCRTSDISRRSTARTMCLRGEAASRCGAAALDRLAHAFGHELGRCRRVAW